MALVQDLISLHRADSQVRALRARVDGARSFAETKQRKFDSARAKLEELQSQARQLQATVMNLEVESKAIQERIDRLREELNSSPNTKQYNALLGEVKHLQSERDEVDDRALSHMERAETIKAGVAECEATQADAAKERDFANAELNQRQKDVGERLSELEQERTKAAQRLAPEALKAFETVAEEHEGEAMAPIEAIGRKEIEYACSACNMLLPPAAASRASSDPNAIVLCPSCRRILYFAPEAPAGG